MAIATSWRWLSLLINWCMAPSWVVWRCSSVISWAWRARVVVIEEIPYLSKLLVDALSNLVDAPIRSCIPISHSSLEGEVMSPRNKLFLMCSTFPRHDDSKCKVWPRSGNEPLPCYLFSFEYEGSKWSFGRWRWFWILVRVRIPKKLTHSHKGLYGAWLGLKHKN